MNIYDDAFPFEVFYFACSLLLSVVIICWRLFFRSEKSRSILYFSSLALRCFHLIVSQSGISTLFKVFGSLSLIVFDEEFLRNMAMIFFLLTWILVFNLFNGK